MNIKQITTPFSEKLVRSLKAGNIVELSGNVLVMRDASHKRFYEFLSAGKKLPISLAGQVIYYVGPTPAPKGRAIGSAGPTTSSRMDKYSPTLILSAGLMGMIGKGDRSKEVISAMQKGPCVYFAATGGAGALLSKCITHSEVVCFPELGPEAVRIFTVNKLPIITAIDCYGKTLFINNKKDF